MLGFDRPDQKEGRKIIQKELLLGLNEYEIKIIDLLQIESHTSEQLILKTEMTAREIQEVISSLEIQGLIEGNGGKFFVK